MPSATTEAVAVMTTALKGAITLFEKDKDLDRSDVLGNIDLGAARLLMRTARVAAGEVLAHAARAGAGAPKAEAAFRQVARLIASDTFKVDEGGFDLLQRVLTAAEQVAQGQAAFEAVIEEAETILSGGQRG